MPYKPLQNGSQWPKSRAKLGSNKKFSDENSVSKVMTAAYTKDLTVNNVHKWHTIVSENILFISHMSVVLEFFGQQSTEEKGDDIRLLSI